MTIGDVDWEAKLDDKSTSVRVGIVEREDNGSVVALRGNWVWERNEKPWKKKEEDERAVESESEIEN